MSNKLKAQDLAALQADVASFAAEVGLASGGNDGFNDVDFRKKKAPIKQARASQVSTANRDRSKSAAAGKNAAAAARSSEADRSKNRSNQGPKNAEKQVANRSPAFSVEKAFDKKKRLEIPADKENKFAKQVSHTFGARWTGEKWYEAAEEMSSTIKFVDTDRPASGDVISKKREEAEFMLKRIAYEFEQSRRNDSSMKWIISARRSGTSADKVAAMTVLIQDNPLSNLQTFDSLLGTVTSKGGKRHALDSIDVLKELFVISLLPDRKLKPFSGQPLAKLPETKEGAMLLLLWFWEDCMRQRYKQFVDALVEGTMDALVFLKLKSLKTLFELLNAKPELERQLLVAIVNKLGDPERKVASNAGYFLSCILNEHPNMKKVIIQEVEAFVFRPNVGLRAIYYASIFLNQLILSNRGEGPGIAKQLIDIYFGLFEAVTKRGQKEEAVLDKNEKRKKQQAAKEDVKDSSIQAVEIDSRLLTALLTGVNRAFPFVKEDDVDTVIEQHTPSLFRMVHSPNLNVGIQALLLLHQLLAKHQAVSDRFHRALYSVLVSGSLPNSTKLEMFLALLFKVLKSDISLSRVAAFVKRLLQVALHQPPNLGCACLFLVSEVLKTKPLLWSFIMEPASEDDDEEHFKDVELPEEQEAKPEITTKSHEEMDMADDSDTDISLEGEIANELGDDDSDDEGNTRKKKTKPPKNIASISASDKPVIQRSAPAVRAFSSAYCAQHRDPLHCNADKCCWWELTSLASHIHPSVATMARTLLCNAHVVYAGNPMHDFTLAAFLDRFAEKKHKPPKKSSNEDIQPKKPESRELAVGMEIAALPEDEVAPEDMIFHRFYSTKAALGSGKQKKRKKRPDVDADELVGSDEDDTDEDDDEGDEEVAAVGDADSGDEGLFTGEAEVGDDDAALVEAESEDEDEAAALNVDSEDEDADAADAGLSDDEEDDEVANAANDSDDSFMGSDDSEDEAIDEFLDEEMAEELAREGGDSDDDESEDDESSFELAQPDSQDQKQRKEQNVENGRRRHSSAGKNSSEGRVQKNEARLKAVPGNKRKKPARGEPEITSQKRPRKGLSPFASADKYSHLM